MNTQNGVGVRKNPHPAIRPGDGQRVFVVLFIPSTSPGYKAGCYSCPLDQR